LITVNWIDQVGDARYVFEAKTIQRMELLVLSTLNWRMQAVTPFSYIDYFLHQLSGGNAPPSRRAVRQAAELILCISRGVHATTLFLPEIEALVNLNIVDRFTHLQEHGAWSSGRRRSRRRSPPPWPEKTTTPWTSAATT
jgi:hypothetical protein